MRHRGSDISLFPAEGDRERLAVRPAHAPSPSARMRGVAAGAGAGGAQEGVKDLAARVSGAEGRGIPAARAAGTLSPGDHGVLVVGRGRGGGERRGQDPPERWDPAPTSPGASEAAEERAPGAGAEASAARRSTEGAAHVAETPARAAEASWGAVAVTPAAATASGEPSRKRKHGFSTLR
jgi:hypothetical protein